MTEEQKVFDDFPKADCNNCRSYWADQCDGAKIGNSRKCTAYEATRQSDIPMQIEKLTKEIKTIHFHNVLLALAILLVALGNLL